MANARATVNNKITLKLDGTVPLDLYNVAVAHFAALVADLTEEIVGAGGVQWTITDLEYGSTLIEATGYAIEDAERVAIGYGLVGRALQTGESIPYSEKIIKDAIGITSVLNGKITGASFGDAIEVRAVVNKAIEYKQQQRNEIRDFGVIEGVVRSISETQALVIGLYDDIFNRRVTCYLAVDRAEQVREIWRKRVRVFGMIRRNPDTGSVIDVREISRIELAEPKVEGALLRARGALQWDDDETPEEAIRRIRDAE